MREWSFHNRRRQSDERQNKQEKLMEFNQVMKKVAAQRRLCTQAWMAPIVAATLFVSSGEKPLSAQVPRVVEITLESAAEMAMNDSYSVRRVRLEIDRTRLLLEAERAALKS